MTLLLALANESYSLVLGDRRLVQNGAVAEDNSNKLCVLFCDDARVVIAYTGVAASGTFRTQDWLRDTLADIGKRKHTLDEMLSELRIKASESYARFPVEQRHIAFLASGYRYSAGAAPEHVCFLLSNFGTGVAPKRANIALTSHDLFKRGTAIVEAGGFKSVLTEKDFASLRMMLEANNPAPAVLHKAVEIVQRVANEPASKRFIGSNCNSAVVKREVNTMVITTYHSARPASRAYGPDVVVAIDGNVSVVTGMVMGIAGAILSGPDIRKNEVW